MIIEAAHRITMNAVTCEVLAGMCLAGLFIALILRGRK